MIFQNQAQEASHPADSLGVALTRANGVISALTACHDAHGGGFAVDGQFVLQAVAAIETFVTDARNAYIELCQKCDLRMIETQNIAPTQGLPEVEVNVSTLPPLPVETKLAPPTKKDDFAPTYEDLMRKLTAAEIFATERDGIIRNDGTAPLLPLLKSLRNDLERLRAA